MSFGLQLAVKLSFRGIITELNCKDCIGYLRFGITFSNALGIALQDCVILSSNLQSCSGLFVQHNGNRVTHALAHLGSCRDHINVRIGEAPLAIDPMLSQDFIPNSYKRKGDFFKKKIKFIMILI